jgi:hypothetical protein
MSERLSRRPVSVSQVDTEPPAATNAIVKRDPRVENLFDQLLPANDGPRFTLMQVAEQTGGVVMVQPVNAPGMQPFEALAGSTVRATPGDLAIAMNVGDRWYVLDTVADADQQIVKEGITVRDQALIKEDRTEIYVYKGLIVEDSELVDNRAVIALDYAEIGGDAGTANIPARDNHRHDARYMQSLAVHRTADGAYIGPATRLDVGTGIDAQDIGGALRKEIKLTNNVSDYFKNNATMLSGTTIGFRIAPHNNHAVIVNFGAARSVYDTGYRVTSDDTWAYLWVVGYGWGWFPASRISASSNALG